MKHPENRAARLQINAEKKKKRENFKRLRRINNDSGDEEAGVFA